MGSFLPLNEFGNFLPFLNKARTFKSVNFSLENWFRAICTIIKFSEKLLKSLRKRKTGIQSGIVENFGFKC